MSFEIKVVRGGRTIRTLSPYPTRKAALKDAQALADAAGKGTKVYVDKASRRNPGGDCGCSSKKPKGNPSKADEPFHWPNARVIPTEIRASGNYLEGPIREQGWTVELEPGGMTSQFFTRKAAAQAAVDLIRRPSTRRRDWFTLIHKYYPERGMREQMLEELRQPAAPLPNPARFFAIVDVSVPGGRWADGRKLYTRAELDQADARALELERMTGAQHQVIDAAYYEPARQVAIKTGLKTNPAHEDLTDLSDADLLELYAVHGWNPHWKAAAAAEIQRRTGRPVSEGYQLLSKRVNPMAFPMPETWRLNPAAHPRFEGATDAEIASPENRRLTMRQLAFRYGKSLDEIRRILLEQDRKPRRRNHDDRLFHEAIPEYNLEVVAGEGGELSESDIERARYIASQVRRGIEEAADVCQLSPPVCAGNMGIPRSQMPQLTETPLAEMLASDDPGERLKAQAALEVGGDPTNPLSVFDQFVQRLKSEGVQFTREQIPVGELKATQREIKAGKTFGMADAFLRGRFRPQDAEILVSSDGHILDGHHRYASLLTAQPDIRMNILRVSMPMREFLEESFRQPGVFRADVQGNIISPTEPLNLSGRDTAPAGSMPPPNWRAVQRSA